VARHLWPSLAAAHGASGRWLASQQLVRVSGTPAEIQQRINDAALAAGRQPQDIRRIYNVMGFITDGPMQGLLTGPVDYWVAELMRLAFEFGMDTFIYWPADDLLRQIERFAAEVVPAVQEQVAKERGIS
jgi:hypothetical protein